ncbi:MAG TPA: hypothetical protein VFA97_08620 [Gaiellaceae bacterium]|nr:hypothetical protein [Gaiellaceae bacterium]
MAESKVIEATEPRRPPFARRLNPDGNMRLTAAVGLVLIVLALAELATLVLGLQTYLRLHVIIGLVLLPPVVLKLLTTGWRFARYYLRNDAYRVKGPPQILMRLLAPLLVLFTVLLFGSGVALGLVHGEALRVARRIHGPAASAWTVTLGLHVLVYFTRALRAVEGDLRTRTRRDVGGASRRALVLLVALVLGLTVGLATLPVQHDWLHLSSRHHNHHDH